MSGSWPGQAGPPHTVEDEALLMQMVIVEAERQALAESAEQLAAMGIRASMADAMAWRAASERTRDRLSNLWLTYMTSEQDFKEKT